MKNRNSIYTINRIVVAVSGCFLILLVISGCTISKEQFNKQLIKEVYEKGINTQNIAYIDSVLANNYTRHSQSSPPGMQEITEKKTFLKFLEMNFNAFPDWSETIEFMVAENDKVALYTTGTAIHEGKMGDIDPTGKSISVKNLIVHRIDENNKIAETWVLWDNVAVLSQLGLYPAPNQ